MRRTVCTYLAFVLQETASMEDSDRCLVAFFEVVKAFDTVGIDDLFKQMFDLGIRGRSFI